ncbi:LOW QUALITY PROTEIN: hypothetical protein PHMEG_00036302, partial [Phytophthora megakarya]
MSSVLLQTEQQRVAFAISKLSGRACEWALTSGSSVDGAFPTWDELKKKLSVVFLPPNHVYCQRSRFLACRQDKKNLLDFVQELRTLIAGMFADPLLEAVTTTVFMDGLRTGVALTEVFHSRPASFEEAVMVALNAEYNFKSAHASWSAPSASTPEGPELMELSSAEEQVAVLRARVAELRASEQRPSVRRCYFCGSPDHLRPRCPLRKARKTASSQATDSSRGNGDSQHGTPAGEVLCYVGPRGGKGQRGLASKRAVLSNTDREHKPGLLVVEATVKDFDKPWIVLTDSVATGNYVRRFTVEGSQLYAEVRQAHSRATVTVRLATGACVTKPKVPLDLGVKFLGFDSTERCLVLDLEVCPSSLVWCGYEPWIDWWSKTLGATHFSPGGALASHEPTSVGTQKRYWRKSWAESAALLDVGVSAIVTDVVEDLGLVLVPQGTVGHPPSVIGRGPDINYAVTRTPLSSARPNGELQSAHLSAVDGLSTHGVTCNPPEQGQVLQGVPLDTGSSGNVSASALGRGGEAVAISPLSTRSWVLRRRRRRRASETVSTSDEMPSVSINTAPRDCREQLYTLVNRVT